MGAEGGDNITVCVCLFPCVRVSFDDSNDDDNDVKSKHSGSDWLICGRGEDAGKSETGEECECRQVGHFISDPLSVSIYSVPSRRLG